MARRKGAARKGRRSGATDHGDFAGTGADPKEVERLQSAGARRGKRGKGGNGSLGLGGNGGGQSDTNIEQHIKDIRQQQARVKSAEKRAASERKLLRNLYKTFDADGGDSAAMKKSFKDAERPMSEVVTERRNMARYEKLMGTPLGTQWDLFDHEGAAVQIDAYAQGEQAGMNGEPADNCPFNPTTESENSSRWRSGWSAGQARLANEKLGRDGDRASP
jgi:ribosome modulation factor